MADDAVAAFIDQSTRDRYYVRDSALVGVHAHAVIDDEGVLHIDLRTVTRRGLRSTILRGNEQFRRILEHFEGRVTAIKGNWQFGTNLEMVNRLTTQGVDLTQAASRTWTGRRAAEAGYTEVVVLQYEGSAGQYTNIQVRFFRPVAYP